MDLEKPEEAWREASDDNVIIAAARDIDEYPAEIQGIIKKEISRRNLADEVEQQKASLRKAKSSRLHPTSKTGQAEGGGGKSRSRKIFDKIAAFIGLMIIIGAIARTCNPPPPRVSKGPVSTPRSVTRHEDIANKYSILYPSSWEMVPSSFVDMAEEQMADNAQILFAVWSPDQKLNMQVQIVKTEESISLNELAEHILAGPLPQYQNISQKEVRIQNLKALESVHTTTTPGGKPAKYVHLFLIREGSAWIVGVGGHPESFDRSRDEIDKVIYSLEFENP